MSDAVFTRCPVLFEDRWLIVIDKPQGVLSHPNPRGEDERCAFEGRYDFDEKTFATPAGTVWLIHRLDQDTSGVLLAAKDEQTADACRLAFGNNEVKKLYLALASGGGLKPHGIWQDHLAVKHERSKVRTEVIRGPRPNAESHFRVLTYSATHRLTLIEVGLITGKTHQIRVQLASRHHPIVGDDVYGDFPLNRRLRKDLGAKRLCLHARRLEFKHPATNAALKIEAPLAKELEAVLMKAGFGKDEG
jgi:RluA family pseudouridine synthase